MWFRPSAAGVLFFLCPTTFCTSCPFYCFADDLFFFKKLSLFLLFLFMWPFCLTGGFGTRLVKYFVPCYLGT